MDLLTQATLGAAMGELVLGRALGWRAMAWGAAIGVLPDADALLTPLIDDLQELTWHRSLTHSLLFCLAAPPLLATALQRLYGEATRWSQWAALAALAVVTHVLLDCCTTFGTQVLWPFSGYPVTFRLVSVVDPLVTLPLLVSLAVCAWLPREARSRRWANRAGLGLATLYLLALLGVKAHMQGALEATLTRSGVDARRTFSKPTLGNGLLWRLVAETDEGYWVGYRSLLDRGPEVEHVRTIARQATLLALFADDPRVQRLLAVLDHAYAVSPEPSGRPGSVLVHDLRYGQWLGWERVDSPYVFTYRLTPAAAGEVEIEVLPRHRPGPELRRSFLARIRGR